MPAISAAPTIWRPAFVGGSLGSGLNTSLLRKLQILAYWLGAIFPGATFTYVQGSPSGSSASKGAHLGPGDAVDLALTVNGRSAPVGVYVIASLILRLLGCIAWVRGQDVNADGVKDDSFAPHLHAIDREGSEKVPAAAAQIAQYLLHQNGLIGGRTDYEVLVRNPLWLDAYTDDLFRTRFMALTKAAATLEAHTEPITKEADMVRLIKHVTHQGGDRTKPVTGQALYVWTPFSGLTPQGGDQAANERLFGQPAEVFEDGEIDGVRVTVDAIVARNIAAVKSAPVTVPAPVVNIDYSAIAKAVRAEIIKEN